MDLYIFCFICFPLKKENSHMEPSKRYSWEGKSLITWLGFDDLSALTVSQLYRPASRSLHPSLLCVPYSCSCPVGNHGTHSHADFPAFLLVTLEVLTDTVGICASHPFTGWETGVSTGLQRSSQAQGGMAQDGLRSRCC